MNSSYKQNDEEKKTAKTRMWGVKKCGPVVKLNAMTANIQAHFSSLFLFLQFQRWLLNITRKHRIDRLIFCLIHVIVMYMRATCVYCTKANLAEKEKSNVSYSKWNRSYDFCKCVCVGRMDIWKPISLVIIVVLVVAVFFFYRTYWFGDR